MANDPLGSGVVVVYSYLWARQAEKGETEGRKERPVAVALRLRDKKGLERIVLLPITSKEPSAERISIEIPEREKLQGGLESAMRLWIILDEVNTDMPGKSYYMTNRPPVGHFSKSWFGHVLKIFVAARASIRNTDRSR